MAMDNNTNSQIIIALVSAILALLGRELVAVIHRNTRLSRIRKLIEIDLKQKEELLDDVEDEYGKLRTWINNDNDGDPMTLKAFEELTLDIYRSNSFPDYYKIFGKEHLPTVISIYQIFDFLIKHLPTVLHNSYVQDINRGFEFFYSKHSNDPKLLTDKNTITRSVIAKITLGNIRNHLSAISELRSKLSILFPALKSWYVRYYLFFRHRLI